MHVGQKVQDGGTLQDSGLDNGNSSDFFFSFLAAGPRPWFPTLLSISLINLPPFSEAKVPEVHSFQNGFSSVFSLELPKKCRRGEDKRGRPTSWLMQRRIACSTHLYESLHYSPRFPGEFHGYKFQPAAPDPWLTGLAFCKKFNISWTEEAVHVTYSVRFAVVRGNHETLTWWPR